MFKRKKKENSFTFAVFSFLQPFLCTQVHLMVFPFSLKGFLQHFLQIYWQQFHLICMKMFFVLPFVFFKNSFAGYRIWGCCCFSFIWFILNKSLYRHCCLLTCIFSNAESASVISSLCIESVTFSLAAYKISSSFLGFH